MVNERSRSWRREGVWAASARLDALDRLRPRAYAALSVAERARVARLADTAADEVILGRWLLRSLAVEALLWASPDGGAPPDRVAPRDVVVVASCDWCGGHHGRPRFPELPLLGSIAHAGGLVVAAVALTARWTALGVDTERLGAHGLDADGLHDWTEHEAVGKALGVGIVGADDDDERRLSAGGPGGWRLDRLDTPGHVTTLALRSPGA